MVQLQFVCGCLSCVYCCRVLLFWALDPLSAPLFPTGLPWFRPLGPVAPLGPRHLWLFSRNSRAGCRRDRLPALAGLVFDPFNVLSAPPPFPPHSLPPFRPRSPPFLPPPLGGLLVRCRWAPPFRACCLGGAPGGRFPVLRRGRGRFPPAPPWSFWSAPWWPQAPRGVAEPRGKVEVSLALGISNIGCYKEDIQMGLAGWDPWSLYVAYLGSGEVML